jgi:hypothetical protein
MGMRGNANLCTRWEANDFNRVYNTSKANVSARTRVSHQLYCGKRRTCRCDGDERGGTTQVGALNIETCYDSDDLRAFGVAPTHSTALAGFLVQSLVNAEEAETHLKEKEMVEVDENEVQMGVDHSCHIISNPRG